MALSGFQAVLLPSPCGSYNVSISGTLLFSIMVSCYVALKAINWEKNGEKWYFIIFLEIPSIASLTEDILVSVYAFNLF